MYPEGNNSPTAFDDECLQIVSDTMLAAGGESCPDLNTEVCGAGDQQDSPKVLTRLFGAPYVDAIAPEIELVEPHDGEYFQAPAEFDVVLELSDDLHPQSYTMWAWYGDGARPQDAKQTVEPGFAVVDLPVGTWAFHVVVADEAGNESQLDFEIEVGLDPPPDPPADSGCGCGPGEPSLAGLVALPLALAMRRRRR
jgi:MYXO-CTERM domain-containing protein